MASNRGHSCVRACVQLLFKGSYYFFRRAPCAAILRGWLLIGVQLLYIQINMVCSLIHPNVWSTVLWFLRYEYRYITLRIQYPYIGKPQYSYTSTWNFKSWDQKCNCTQLFGRSKVNPFSQIWSHTITTLYMHTYLKYKALKDSKGCSCKSMEAENNIIKLNRVDSSWIAMKVLSLCGQ